MNYSPREGKYHLELSKEDFQDCQVYQQGGQQFFCGFGPLLQSAKAASCVIQVSSLPLSSDDGRLRCPPTCHQPAYHSLLQLFNVDGEGAMCQSRLTHGLVQPFTR
jgi:hypothetical protein